MMFVYKEVPARIHVLMASKSNSGLVIRRGPSKHVCTFGWDRSNDEFTIGQWLKGRIYERRSDISPDGKHFLYFAMNGKWDSETGGSWTAMSVAPYLKAIGLWGKGDCWHGGGLFLRNNKFWINAYDHHKELRSPNRLNRVDDYEGKKASGYECPGVYYLRLMRDGWIFKIRRNIEKRHEIDVFEKQVSPDWVLRKLAHGTLDSPEGKGCYYDEHELVNSHTSQILDFHSWEWADWDRNRLVWAEKGRLCACEVNESGIANLKDLYDFNSMTFEPIAAPY